MLTLPVKHDFEGFAGAVHILANEAKKLEREMAMGAQPYEPKPSRPGCTNGFKLKTVETQLEYLALITPAY